jgi:hypothetical protein
MLVTALYWWHPVVWWARREVHLAEEECCDAWVVAVLPGAGHAYASTLLLTLDFLAAVPPALPAVASGMGRVYRLRRRFTMIMTGTPLPGANWLGRLALGCVALLLLLSPCGPGAAEPPKKGTGDAPPAKKADGPKKEARTVEGVVERFVTGPKGDIHGLVLSDGTEVRYPPHLAKKVTGIVARKDRVQVKGELHTGPKGDSHLNARFITNLKSGEAVALTGPKPPKEEKAKPKKEARTVEGVVERFLTGPRGEVRGLVLGDGTEVHFPPHLGEKVTGVVGKKDRVQVKGELHTGPKGDSHLNAKFITNLKSGEAVALTGPKTPKKEK